MVLGRSTGPTDLRSTTGDGRALLLVARVDPHDGTVRWVRHLALLDNRCVSIGVPISLDVDAAGRVFVSLFTSGDGAIDDQAIATGTDPGPVVASFEADGAPRWVHRLSGTAPRDETYVAGLAADGTGGALVVVSHATGPAVVRLGPDGSPLLVVPFTAAPLTGPACSNLFHGSYVYVDSLRRTVDGSLLVYGQLGGTSIVIDQVRVDPRPRTPRPESFWLRFEPDGRPRWASRTPLILEEWTPAGGDEVLAVVHTPAHDREVRRIDARTGQTGPALLRWDSDAGTRGAQLGIVGGRTMAIIQHGSHGTGTYGGVTVTSSSGTPTRSASIVGELIGQDRFAPGPLAVTAAALGGRTSQFGGGSIADFVEVPGGAIVAVGSFTGRLEAGGQSVEYRQRMVDCHPGPVGEERTLPPDCREPIDELALFVLSWRPAP